MSVFQKNLFTKTSFTSFISTSFTVIQQSILYMSISVLKSAEASHFNEMNVTDFLEI